MWVLVFVLCLVQSSTTFARESRGQLQVGITINGNANSPAVNPKPAAGAIAKPEVSVPLPTERPAANGQGDRAPFTR
jgi:hypothetical protein